MAFERIAGRGWLALIGGGEFSFGETEAADAEWLERAGAGALGFVPAASGSEDYGRHLAVYFDELFERRLEVVPIYRGRDARRGRNAERLGEVEHVYLGGGVTDHLVETVADTPALAALEARLEAGGTVVAIAGAAQGLGVVYRSLFGGKIQPGLGWLPGGAVETNFDPEHDRRLRQLAGADGVSWAVGIAAGSALLLGPDGQVETIGDVWWLESPQGEPKPLRPQPALPDDAPS
ncbi:MAG: Type 1 glutamine amidotransferase-like domain-containing protein [Acidobacteriota bacterium]